MCINTKKSKVIALSIIALLQIILWAPYLLDCPLTLPSPIIVGGRWIIWSEPYFCLGTATDFVPALAMVTAGILTLFFCIWQIRSTRALSWIIWTNVGAISILIVMQVIGTIMGVVSYSNLDLDIWLLLTIFFWFGPPSILSAIAWKIRKFELMKNT